MEFTEVKLKSIGWFLCLVLVCIGSSIAGQMFFPGDGSVPRAIRMALAATGTIVLAIGSERLLRKEIPSGSGLGLFRPGKAALGISVGTVGAALWIGLIAGVLFLVTGFRFERGSLEGGALMPALHQYFWNNAGEELVFRGYLLVLLMRAIGLSWALLIVSVVFGVFHLPGLSGMAAVKMVLTTGACSYLFAAVFLATGTLWTAMALHAVGNLLLHTITGLSGGRAMLRPVFEEGYPASDPGFWISLAVPLLLAWGILKGKQKRDERLRTAGDGEGTGVAVVPMGQIERR